jgi:hypothetical protein
MNEYRQKFAGILLYDLVRSKAWWQDSVNQEQFIVSH